MEVIDKLALVHIENRRVLMARSKGKDKFYAAGGKREGKETNEEALVREVKEELGVDLIPETITYLNTFRAQAHGKPEGVMVELKCYQGNFHGKPKPMSEIEELTWFSTADLERTTIPGRLLLTWLKGKNLVD